MSKFLLISKMPAMASKHHPIEGIAEIRSSMKEAINCEQEERDGMKPMESINNTLWEVNKPHPLSKLIASR
jgi:hypothetical protein